QIGRVIDNTSKTRYLFEINKGVNKNPSVSVNASIAQADRRIPIENMIYIADGPSDIPMFAVVKERGGKTFAVHASDSLREFKQNDMLLQNGRVDCYGPADYRPGTQTYRWLMMHVTEIAERLVQQEELQLKTRIHNPPPYRGEEKPKDSNLQMGLFD
ncbi:MAG: haloacid dehalogenase-like hydrolase, partial [bacterium]